MANEILEEWQKLRAEMIVEAKDATELFHAFALTPSQWLEAAKMKDLEVRQEVLPLAAGKSL